MAGFPYNILKNTNTSYTRFEFNGSYHPRASFKKDINFYLKSCFTNKLARAEKTDGSLLLEPTQYIKIIEKCLQ